MAAVAEREVVRDWLAEGKISVVEAGQLLVDYPDEVRDSIAHDTLQWAPKLLKIVPKDREMGLIPLKPKRGQTALEERLRAQREAGLAMRVIILKGRQIGMTTWCQGKLILPTTQLPHTNSLTVAHEDDAVKKIYRIGERMHRNLPAALRPEVRAFKRNDHIHFGQKGDLWAGAVWPDSVYELGTAGSPEAGRAGTYHRAHLSEYAFYPQPEQKLIAVMQAVPDDPDTFVAIESTPNGHNHFKSLWDQAVEGHSDFIAFFWPWWKEDEYQSAFMAGEREEFRPGDLDQSPFAEEELELLDPGPIDVDTGEHVPLTLEQLKWRRETIANKCGGKIEKFHQEYPATPEQGFLSTGRKVFEPMLVARAMAQAERTDPRVGQGGPVLGGVLAGKRISEEGRFGEVQVPKEPRFKPARELELGEDPYWRFWLPLKDGVPVIPKDRAYMIGGDVSEGLPESEDDGADPAFHALQVIDHKTRTQVAEYRSRVDPDLFAEHALLAALLFNEAWLAIERTGPGRAVVRRLRHDFHYPFMYKLRHHATDQEKQGAEFGWDTNRKTKPILLAGGQQLLREGTHGVKSRRLVAEMITYIRTSTGKTLPEKGKFADLLMAWLIAQQVAEELPPREIEGASDDEEDGDGLEVVRSWQPRDVRTGY